MEFTSWNIRPDELYHFGTKGMRWGQRRYQNEDGSLTELGRQRYGKGGKRGALGRSMDLNKLESERARSQSRSDYYKAKANDRYSRQKYRAQKKGLPMPKMDEKSKKWTTKSKEYQELANRSKKMTDRILRDTAKKKMSVYSQDTVASDYNGYIGSRQYSVRNNGKGIRAHKSRDTQAMINNAYRRRAYRAAALGYVVGKRRGESDKSHRPRLNFSYRA